MWSYLSEMDENLALPLSLPLPLESYLSNASNSVSHVKSVVSKLFPVRIFVHWNRIYILDKILTFSFS